MKSFAFIKEKLLLIPIYKVVFALLCLFILTGFGCRQTSSTVEKIDRALVMWGLWQESEDMQPIIEAFTAQTGVEIEYQKIASVAEYERQLWAANLFPLARAYSRGMFSVDP